MIIGGPLYELGPNYDCTLPFNLTEAMIETKLYRSCALDYNGRAYCPSTIKTSINTTLWDGVGNWWGYCSESCPIMEPPHGNNPNCIKVYL